VKAGGKALVANTGGDTIRVRADVGTEHKQVAEAYGGQTVAVTAGPRKDSKGRLWYKIDGPNGTGWIMAAFLTGTGGAAATAKPAADKQASKPAAEKSANVPQITDYGKIANSDGDRVRVRTDAARNGSVSTTLAPGAVVTVKGGAVVDREGIAWYPVSAGGTNGWVMAQYLAQAQAPAKVEERVAPAPAPPAAQPAAPAAEQEARSGTARGPQPPQEVQSASIAQAIVSIAMKYNGARYRFGGSSPSGFDCSGFVYYVVGKAGKRIARTIPGQIGAGTKVSSKELQPGDLVFFSNTYKRGLSHAGIYVGNGKFIHAQNEGTGVLVSSLWSAYWASHYTTAIRLR
jgi:cell wall-associated NlpC family hydrolase